MNLHNDIKLFERTVRAASEYANINEVFIEKDYWITFVLNQLSKSKYSKQTVFKGGTSLSKGYRLINRFSEDVDIAVINKNKKSGNEIKNIIRNIEREMTKGLNEVYEEGITSKGSKFRKSVFEYDSIDTRNRLNKLIVEVNSFADPYPFQNLDVNSFIFDFLSQTENEKYIEQFGLFPFRINILNKEQTLIEKLVSLIRFSFDKNIVESMASKIRHFYDLYFLMNDNECFAYIASDDFKKRFDEILKHDREFFDEPEGWNTKSVAESPLISDFENIWDQLKETYKTELSALAFAEIPDERKAAGYFKTLMKMIQ
jgi:predicted nucleotidyltransferase component of viral defense system